MAGKKIWAAHAISSTRAAVSIGELNDEDPFSTIFVYDENRAERWWRIPIRKTIMALTSVRVEGTEDAFVAMSDDGDVYFLHHQEPRVEQIPGAGTGGENSTGQGTMSFIRGVDNWLYACGNAAQVYVRHPSGGWDQLCRVGSDGMGRNSFLSVDARDPRAVVVCGYTDVKYTQGTPEQQAELARLKKVGPMTEYIKLRKQLKRVDHYARGCLYFFDGKNWTPATLPNDQYLNDVIVLDARRVIAAGSGGTLLAGENPDTLEDVSIDGLMEKFHAVRRRGDLVYVLVDTSILTFDSRLANAGAISLPEGFAKPNLLDVVEGAIWYFDYEGVARYRDGNWEMINIPAEL